MARLDYNGSYPLDRVTMKGHTFRKCTIRNWTLTNCRIASRRRCRYLLDQLPLDAQWVEDFWLQVNLGIPGEIEAVERELRKAIAVYAIIGA